MIDKGYSSIRGDIIDTYMRERKIRSDACPKLLRGFQEWLKQRNLTLFDFQLADVEEYCNEKTNKGEWKGSSANTFVAYLKGFCKWLSGYALSNEENARLRRIRGMRIDNTSTAKRAFFLQSLNLDMYKKLLEFAYDKSPHEDFIYFWLLGWHGFRVGEFTSVPDNNILFTKSKFNGINIPSNALWVETEKTRFMRLLFFDEFTAKLWKTVKMGKLNIHVNTQHIRNRMRRYDKLVGIHLHPHQLRMLFNTYMKNVVNANSEMLYKKFGVLLDENLVKVMMGHSVVMKDMTELYNKYSPEIIKYVMSELHYMKDLEKYFDISKII